MLASLIPFFLVAHVSVNDGVWKHGPEYIFDVETNTTSFAMSKGKETTRRANFTMITLNCRPKGADSLSCYVSNCKGQSVDLTTENQMEMSEDVYKSFCDSDTFELRFNERGLSHLIVNYRTPVHVLNGLKRIGECLSIGADFQGVPDGDFDVPQNTTIGECSVKVKFQHYPLTTGTNKMKNVKYELESLPQLNKVPGEVIVIEMNTNVTSCRQQGQPGSFTDPKGEQVVPQDVWTVIRNIFVSDMQLSSKMFTSGSFAVADNEIIIKESVSVTLRDIRAASRELTEVPEAAKTSIVVNSRVNKLYNHY